MFDVENYVDGDDTIYVSKSPTADSRSCDPKTVSLESLRSSTLIHINDVQRGLRLFSALLTRAGIHHDHDKIGSIEEFHEAFQKGFPDEEDGSPNAWLVNHRKVNRHHLMQEVPSDVNLIDILEMISDIVMAGSARSGEVYPLELSDDVLQKAVKNTVNLLIKNVTIVD